MKGNLLNLHEFASSANKKNLSCNRLWLCFGDLPEPPLLHTNPYDVDCLLGTNPKGQGGPQILMAASDG